MLCSNNIGVCKSHISNPPMWIIRLWLLHYLQILHLPSHHKPLFCQPLYHKHVYPCVIRLTTSRLLRPNPTMIVARKKLHVMNMLIWRGTLWSPNRSINDNFSRRVQYLELRGVVHGNCKCHTYWPSLLLNIHCEENSALKLLQITTMTQHIYNLAIEMHTISNEWKERLG